MSGEPFLALHDLEDNDLLVSVSEVVAITAAIDGATEITLSSGMVRVTECTDEIMQTLIRITDKRADA